MNIQEALLLIKNNPEYQRIRKTEAKKIQEEIKKPFEACTHNGNKNDCLFCDYEEFNPRTDHEIAKRLYRKHSELFRHYEHEKNTTEENLQAYRKDVNQNYKRLTQLKIAGDYNTLIYFLDRAKESYPSDDELTIISYLAKQFFKLETIRPIGSLTYKQEYLLNDLRRHIFRVQISNIKRRLERQYGLKWNR